MNAGPYIAGWLLLNCFAVAVYDLAAFWTLPPENSASFYVHHWMRTFPILAVCFGILIGHLVWPISQQLDVAKERISMR